MKNKKIRFKRICMQLERMPHCFFNLSFFALLSLCWGPQGVCAQEKEDVDETITEAKRGGRVCAPYRFSACPWMLRSRDGDIAEAEASSTADTCFASAYNQILEGERLESTIRQPGVLPAPVLQCATSSSRGTIDVPEDRAGREEGAGEAEGAKSFTIGDVLARFQHLSWSSLLREALSPPPAGGDGDENEGKKLYEEIGTVGHARMLSSQLVRDQSYQTLLRIAKAVFPSASTEQEWGLTLTSRSLGEHGTSRHRSRPYDGSAYDQDQDLFRDGDGDGRSKNPGAVDAGAAATDGAKNLSVKAAAAAAVEINEENAAREGTPRRTARTDDDESLAKNIKLAAHLFSSCPVVVLLLSYVVLFDTFVTHVRDTYKLATDVEGFAAAETNLRALLQCHTQLRNLFAHQLDAEITEAVNYGGGDVDSWREIARPVVAGSGEEGGAANRRGPWRSSLSLLRIFEHRGNQVLNYNDRSTINPETSTDHQGAGAKDAGGPTTEGDGSKQREEDRSTQIQHDVYFESAEQRAVFLQQKFLNVLFPPPAPDLETEHAELPPKRTDGRTTPIVAGGFSASRHKDTTETSKSTHVKLYDDRELASQISSHSSLWFGQEVDKITPFAVLLHKYHEAVTTPYRSQQTLFAKHFLGHTDDSSGVDGQTGRGEADKSGTLTEQVVPGQDTDGNDASCSHSLPKLWKRIAAEHGPAKAVERVDAFLAANRQKVIEFAANAQRLFDHLQNEEKLITAWTIRGGTLLSSLRYGDWMQKFELPGGKDEQKEAEFVDHAVQTETARNKHRTSDVDVDPPRVVVYDIPNDNSKQVFSRGRSTIQGIHDFDVAVVLNHDRSTSASASSSQVEKTNETETVTDRKADRDISENLDNSDQLWSLVVERVAQVAQAWEFPICGFLQGYIHHGFFCHTNQTRIADLCSVRFELDVIRLSSAAALESRVFPLADCALGPLTLPCPRHANTFLHRTLGPSAWYENATIVREKSLSCFALPPVLTWMSEDENETVRSSATDGSSIISIGGHISSAEGPAWLLERIFRTQLGMNAAGFANVGNMFGVCDDHAFATQARLLWSSTEGQVQWVGSNE
ncbi:unnamed protein product [Amoebophrya sp. A120]|nr:unnamed protein product [Amoebophrya sp. A120]|eukprot:GSA120T00018311001.1